MDILDFGAPELLLVVSFVATVAITVYTIKALHKGIAAAKEK